MGFFLAQQLALMALRRRYGARHEDYLCLNLQENSEATLYDVRRLYSCLAHLTTPRYRVMVKYHVSSED